MNKDKLKKILKVLSPDKTSVDFTDIDKEVSKLKESLKQKVVVSTLEEVSVELEKFKRKMNLQPIFDSIEGMKKSVDSKIQVLINKIETKNSTENKEILADLQSQLSTLEEVRKVDLSKIKAEVSDIEDKSNVLISELSLRLDTVEGQEVVDWQKKLDALRKDILLRISGIGGGSMNRKVTFGGVDYLTKYTDINYKAGSNVTFTVANNNTTKMVDVTIASSGGGAGTVRSINSVSISTSAGSTSGTDYVYLCSGTMTLTLPDATANTNLYTVKNVGTGTVTINTTSAQTIDGSLTIVMPVQYTAVDLISDTANWNVT